jgi:hypothetical protein
LIIFGDNQGAFALLKHPNAHQRTKHIDEAFHCPGWAHIGLNVLLALEYKGANC